MPYYISVDGGGTKLYAILFDHQFKLLGSAKGEAVNLNFDTQENIRLIIQNCISQCIRGYEGITLDHVYVAIPGAAEEVIEVLSRDVRVTAWTGLNEGMMSLYAGIQKKNGLLVLSGTGSGVYWIDGNHTSTLGGWGSYIGDDGSGYCIGRDGINAVIRCHEGWGPETRLAKILVEEWKLEDMREILGKVYGSKIPRKTIAAVAPLVARACMAGDPVALAIYEKAGEVMAQQALALLVRVHPQDEPFTVTTAGGAWKGCEEMHEAFRRTIQRVYPQADIKLPLFEPVMGGVIMEAFKENEQISEDFKKHLFNEFYSCAFHHHTGAEELRHAGKKVL